MKKSRYEKEVVEALDLFLPKSKYIQQKFINAVMLYMQASGICFTDYLVHEMKEVKKEFKHVTKTLPKSGKRKK